MRAPAGLAAVAVLAAVLSACAGPETEAPPSAAPGAVAALVAPPPPKPAVMIRFDCLGTLLHPPVAGVGESPIRFWLGVREDGTLDGRVDQAGTPLDLGPGPLSGHMSLRYDTAGRLIGGTALVNWPHSRDGRAVELSLMRETFIASGSRANGVGQIRHRASDHTYVTGGLMLDPQAHPALAGMARVTVLSATCLPNSADERPVAAGR